MLMTQLSALLQQDRVVTSAKLDEAEARRTDAGGDLTTCLLEVGALGEDTLTAYQAAVLGIEPCLRADLFDADPTTLAKLPRGQAELFGAVPLFSDGDGVLQVAVAEAPSEVLRNALRSMFRQPVELMAVLPFRLRWALWRYYQSPLEPRFVALAEKLAGADPGAAPKGITFRPSVEPPKSSPSGRPASRALAALLDDEDDEDNDDAEGDEHDDVPSPAPRSALPPPAPKTGVAASRPPSKAPVAPSRPPHTVLATTARPIAPDLDDHLRTTAVPEVAPDPPRFSKTRPPTVTVPRPEPPPRANPPSTRPLPPVAPGAIDELLLVPGTRGALSPPGLPRFEPEATPVVEEPPRRPKAISIEEAEVRLGAATDRDAVLATMLDHLMRDFDYAALFVLRGSGIEPQAARGEGAELGLLRGYKLDLAEAPRLAEARDKGEVVIVRFSAGSAETGLRDRLGRKSASAAAVGPVKIQGRSALLLWADSGARTPSPATLHELTRFLDLCGAAFTRIVVSRKQSGSLPPTPSKRPVSASPAPLRPSSPPPKPSERPWQPSPEQRMAALRSAVLGQGTGQRRSVPPAAVGPVAPTEGRPVSRPQTPSGGRGPTPRPATPRPRTPKPVSGQAQGALIPGAVGPRFGTMGDAEKMIAEVARTGLLSDETAATLVAMGERALEVVFRHFPGVHMPLGETSAGRGPSAEELGPVIRLALRFRQAAVPWLLRTLDGADADADARLCALLCLGDVTHPGAIPRLTSLLLDGDAVTRATTTEVLKAYQRFPEFESVLRTLRTLVRDTRSQPEARRVAAQSLGEFRDVSSVETLIDALVDADAGLVQSAHRALVTLTRQDHGSAPEGWRHWHERMRSRHRVEWLIEALLHTEAGLRHDASEELKKVTGQFFGYYFNLPRKERERAHQRYVEWWRREGALKFTGRPAP